MDRPVPQRRLSLINNALVLPTPPLLQRPSEALPVAETSEEASTMYTLIFRASLSGTSEASVVSRGQDSGEIIQMIATCGVRMARRWPGVAGSTNRNSVGGHVEAACEAADESLRAERFTQVGLISIVPTILLVP
ncbi:hypothetical protein RRG08_034515 [Elysia crispata]|uniref:Uncharacterized protein n=1 Tax=Elysia crispata TaxID=231223 RepID=A0AAE1BAD0_9GAST|nr:hypothetical protein RRG08_034515 [Elysia crispata]